MRQQIVAPFAIASLDQAKGEFTGVASVYGNTDLVGDIVEAGAFADDIRANGKERPLLWQHKWDMPIGLVELEDSASGLKVRGLLDMDVDEGRRAFSALAKRYVKGLSIGYDTLKDRVDGRLRRLQKLKLWEVSVVTFPANPEATVRTTKADADEWAEVESLLARTVSRVAMESKLMTTRLRVKELEARAQQVVAAPPRRAELDAMRERVRNLKHRADRRRRAAMYGQTGW